MKLRWFTRKGPVFLPSSPWGWAILLAAVAYLVWTFIDIDSRSHSVSDTLINFVFNGLIVAAGYSLLAFFASSKEEA
jgi:hypothetical protein